MKIKGAAHPFDPQWEAYVQYRERQLALKASSAFRANVLQQQHGRCPRCQQVLQYDESLELHHQDGNHQNNRLVNLVLLHPNCHRQAHYAPDRYTEPTRPSRGAGHA